MKNDCENSEDAVLSSSKNFHDLKHRQVVFALDFTQGMAKPFRDLGLDFYEIDKSVGYIGKHDYVPECNRLEIIEKLKSAGKKTMILITSDIYLINSGVTDYWINYKKNRPTLECKNG